MEPKKRQRLGFIDKARIHIKKLFRKKHKTPVFSEDGSDRYILAHSFIWAKEVHDGKSYMRIGWVDEKGRPRCVYMHKVGFDFLFEKIKS